MNATTTIANHDAPANADDRLALAVRGLEPESAASLRTAFESMFAQAEDWATKAALIKVTSIEQKREMKLARESRLALREIRINAEKTRKRLKEDSLRRGKAIDGIYNVIAALIEPIEAHLLDQEQFAERAEAARKDALCAARIAALSAYGADASMFGDLGAATEETWAQILETARLAHEAKLDAARKAEAERAAREKAEAEAREAARAEAEKQRAENERLRKEAAEREAAIKAERAKVEAERRAAEEKARAEQEAVEAMARAERDAAEALARHERAARERAEAELAAAKTADAARIAAEEEARQQAALAPDREKLAAFAAALRSLPMPEMATARGKAAAAKIAAQVERMAASIDRAVASEAAS